MNKILCASNFVKDQKNILVSFAEKQKTKRLPKNAHFAMTLRAKNIREVMCNATF